MKASFVSEESDDWHKKRKKAKKFAAVGLTMALVAIVIDYFMFQGIGRGANFQIDKAFNYGFVVDFILFPIMIVGIALFVINLYRFIKYR